MKKQQQVSNNEREMLYNFLKKDYSEFAAQYRAHNNNDKGFAAYSRLISLPESTLNRLWREWDKEGVIGDGTWVKIRQYFMSKTGFKLVKTANIEKIYEACNHALNMKRTLLIEGQSGFGKSQGLKKYQEAAVKQNLNVLYVDASLDGNAKPKHLVSEIMKVVTTYQKGTITFQIKRIAEALRSKESLLIIDEVSALKGMDITVLKDIMTALHGLAGLVLAGVPYFMRTVRSGADRDAHLFKELRDRIFLTPYVLEPPTMNDAKEIALKNGLSESGWWVMNGLHPKTGKSDSRYALYNWQNKPTYRGIVDAILSVKSLVDKRQKIKVSEF